MFSGSVLDPELPFVNLAYFSFGHRLCDAGLLEARHVCRTSVLQEKSLLKVPHFRCRSNFLLPTSHFQVTLSHFWRPATGRSNGRLEFRAFSVRHPATALATALATAVHDRTPLGWHVRLDAHIC
jgi:hypothetical protein